MENNYIYIIPTPNNKPVKIVHENDYEKNKERIQKMTFSNLDIVEPSLTNVSFGPTTVDSLTINPEEVKKISNKANSITFKNAKMITYPAEDYVNWTKTLTGTLRCEAINQSLIDAICHPNKIKNIDQIRENVTIVTFADGHVEKMILQEPDTFDMESCLYYALAKKLYKKDYTWEGVEKKTEELRYMKEYVKIVQDGLKLWKKICKEKDEKIAEEQRINHKKEKRAAYKKRRAEKKRQDKIDIIAEAIKKANA